MCNFHKILITFGRKGKGREGKGRERKGREGRGREGKEKQGKETDNVSFLTCFWRVCYLILRVNS